METELVSQLMLNSCWAAALEMYFDGNKKQKELLVQHATGLDEFDKNNFYQLTTCPDINSDYYGTLNYRKDKAAINRIINGENSKGFLFYFKTDLSRDGSHVVYLSKYYTNRFNYIPTFDPWPRCKGLKYFSTIEGIEWWLSKSPDSQGILPYKSDCYSVENRLNFNDEEALVQYLISNISHFPYPPTGDFTQGRNSLIIKFLIDSTVLKRRGWLAQIFTPDINISEKSETINLDYGEQYMIPFFDDDDNCMAVRINSTDSKGNKKWIINRFEKASFLKDYHFLRPKKSYKRINIISKQSLSISSNLIAVHFTQADIFCLIEKIDKDYYQISDPYGCLDVLDFKRTQTISEQNFIDKYLIPYLSIAQKK